MRLEGLAWQMGFQVDEKREKDDRVVFEMWWENWSLSTLVVSWFTPRSYRLIATSVKLMKLLISFLLLLSKSSSVSLRCSKQFSLQFIHKHGWKGEMKLLHFSSGPALPCNTVVYQDPPSKACRHQQVVNLSLIALDFFFLYFGSNVNLFSRTRRHIKWL